jgi:hypothetical protein
MAKKRGRPRGTVTGNAKAGVLHVRVDDLERDGFAEAARLAGLTTSAWARERLREVCRTELAKHGRKPQFLA